MDEIDQAVETALQKAIDTVKAANNGELRADDLCLLLACEIVARDRTLKEVGEVSFERIASKLDQARALDRTRFHSALVAIRSEALSHGEHNPISGITRLPLGYQAIARMADEALQPVN